MPETKDCHSSFLVCLKFCLDLHFSKRTTVNLAEFSRKAGFKSRSFLSQVLSGQKGLSRDALVRICSTLKVPAKNIKLLELLGYRDFPDTRLPTMSEKSLASMISQLRFELTEVSAEITQKRFSRTLAGSLDAYRVYASLGTLETGANLNEIKQRSRLTLSVIKANLFALISEGFVRQEGQRYFALAQSVDRFGLTANDGLAELIRDSCQGLQDSIQAKIDQKTNQIFLTIFSMHSSKISEFRSAMQAAVFQVIDQYQDDSGDVLRELLLTNISN